MEAETFLEQASSLKDGDINLAHMALVLAAIEEQTASIERYENHLKKLAQETAAHHMNLLRSGEDTALLQLQALKDVLHGRYEYTGDTENYDDSRNASLIQVMDRRKGLPITLAILYIQVGRMCGFETEGLDFPGHFICRLDKDGQRLIFDPFNDGALLEAPDLRALLKKAQGKNAELSATYFEPATNRAMLLRLQNNIKYRQIELEDYISALKTVERMRRIDPLEYRLLLDAGVLYARTGQPRAAITCLEDYIPQIPQGRDRQEAERLLNEIRQTLH